MHIPNILGTREKAQNIPMTEHFGTQGEREPDLALLFDDLCYPFGFLRYLSDYLCAAQHRALFHLMKRRALWIPSRVPH